MLFYVQMKWNYQGRLSQDELWQMEAKEGDHGIEGIKSGLVKGLYKVVSQHRIVAIVDVDTLENLDRNSMGWLPMREYLEFEQVWALRDYVGFIQDVKAGFPLPTAIKAIDNADNVEQSVNEEETRTVAQSWFSALKAGSGALNYLDDNIIWINNPPEKGLSDIIPWLGEYHGLEAVKGSFEVWGSLSEVQEFELKKLVTDGDEVLAIVHEVAKIKATGLNYDIEFIQRFRVSNGKIVFWKSYWDTVKGIVPFRGDMCNRLVEAAKTGNEDELDRLLPFGADPNAIDKKSNQSVLMIAASRGHVRLVTKLLKYGADPNLLDKRAGATALHKACQGKHLDVVKVLLEAEAFIDIQTPTTGHTPVVEAIWFKADDIVEYLLSCNARIEIKTYYGFSIDDHIKYAKQANKGETGLAALDRIEKLVNLRRESDKNKEANQTLINAVIKGDLNSVEDSIKCGEDIDQRHPMVGSFHDAHTPLLIASRDAYKDKQTYIEIVKQLIAAGADTNAVEPIFGAVPLHKATYNGNTDIVKLLVQVKDIDLNYQGPSNGYTPLHDALWHAYADCASVLIDAGARTDIIAYDGKLPIDIAIEELGKNDPIVEKLGIHTASVKIAQNH